MCPAVRPERYAADESEEPLEPDGRVGGARRLGRPDSAVEPADKGSRDELIPLP